MSHLRLFGAGGPSIARFTSRNHAGFEALFCRRRKNLSAMAEPRSARRFKGPRALGSGTRAVRSAERPCHRRRTELAGRAHAPINRLTPPRHEWGAVAPGLAPTVSILIVQPNPAHRASGLVAALGGEVEPVEGAHQQFGPAVIGRVAVEDGTALVLHEGAYAEHVLTFADDRTVIIDRASGGDVLGSERHAEIEVEVAAVRGDEGEGPAHPVHHLLDPPERRARDRGEREVGLFEMLPRRVDMVSGERAARADMIRVRRQHEVIDGELPAAAEQVAERAFALGPCEDIRLLDPDPGQLPALGAQGVQLVRPGALLG